MAPTDDTAPMVRVLAAVIVREGRYLLCRRPPHKRHGGMWEFPGGKLEGTETDSDTARRELHEELGVRATHVGEALLCVHDEGSPYTIAFVPVTAEGDPACLEHTALAWATLEELTHYALAPSDATFVAWLEDVASHR